MRLPRAAALLAALAIASLGAKPLSAQRPRGATVSVASQTLLDTATLTQLKWRHIGPEGNRVTSVTGVPGDRTTYYAGAASGGLWKSSDGGIHWKPVFDDQPVSSIGALTVAPSDHNIVWAGTGEPFIRSN